MISIIDLYKSSLSTITNMAETYFFYWFMGPGFYGLLKFIAKRSGLW